MAKVEIFSAGCSCCLEAIQAVQAAACPACTIHIYDMNDPAVAAQAKQHGIKRVPAVVINGKLADCCAAGGIDIPTLQSLGLGQG